MRRTPANAVALVLALASLSVLAIGCGDDDESAGKAVEGPDVERYCELSAELDRAGSESFRELEKDPQASKADFEAAEREFVESNQANLDETAQVAPEEISQDVETLIASLRARAGLGTEVDEAEAGSAEKRVQAFEQENCET